MYDFLDDLGMITRTPVLIGETRHGNAEFYQHEFQKFILLCFVVSSLDFVILAKATTGFCKKKKMLFHNGRVHFFFFFTCKKKITFRGEHDINIHFCFTIRKNTKKNKQKKKLL